LFPCAPTSRILVELASFESPSRKACLAREVPLIHRTSTAALVALMPLFAAGCAIDFDAFIGTGGGGVGGQGGSTTTTTTTTTTGGGGQGGQGGTGGGGCIPADCDDGNPCTADSCNAGTCEHPNATNPDLSAEDDPSDCRDPICVGDQLMVAGGANDDAEVPASDGEVCTKDICSGGVAYPPEDAGVDCTVTGTGNPGKCNGGGACVSCNVAADCGATTTCITAWACTGSPLACVPTYAPDTTKVGDDGLSGNCKATFCDGSGGTMTGNDDSDLPSNTNQCKTATCTNGTPSTPNKSDGSACDDGASEAGGQCKTGNCVDCTSSAGGCSSGHTCVTATNVCCAPMDIPTACAAAGKVCGMVSDGCGGMVTCPGCGSSLDGPDCVNNNASCGCNMNNDCSPGTQWGDACVSGKCGCNVVGDCTAPDAFCETTSHKCVECLADGDCSSSTKGKDCLPTFVCGCDANSPDCDGVGAGTCNTTTGVCNP
jgi:hypothetical protein